jgi:hypothetical protein
MALVGLVVQGQLGDEAFADPVGTHLVLAKTVNWGIGIMANTPPNAELVLDPQGEQAVLALQGALGINAEALGGGAGRRIFVELVLPQLIAMASKFIEEWLARRTAGG